MVFLFFISISSNPAICAFLAIPVPDFPSRHESGQQGGEEGVRRDGDEGDEEQKNADAPYLFIEPEWLDIRFPGPIPQHQRPLGRKREREPSAEINSGLDFEQEASMIAESKQGLGPGAPNPLRLVLATPGWTDGTPGLKDDQGSWNGSGDFFDDGGYAYSYSPLGSSGNLLFPSKSPSSASDLDAGILAQQHICSECSSAFEKRCELK
ncbi:hypothetical protein GX51_05252 [Blastomyces parvus]|uniref:Uncharacterized protein n=1 Tax=Blastomyces parvus TaxID=2060905 RepID=A0A2B7WXP6_9EURO|nr:hypothetical protein GX51_05252 [Blastomyces parvus]